MKRLTLNEEEVLLLLACRKIANQIGDLSDRNGIRTHNIRTPHTYAFQSESTLYSCLNVKEILARKELEQKQNFNAAVKFEKYNF